jgi:hypothetical protein
MILQDLKNCCPRNYILSLIQGEAIIIQNKTRFFLLKDELDIEFPLYFLKDIFQANISDQIQF